MYVIIFFFFKLRLYGSDFASFQFCIADDIILIFIYFLIYFATYSEVHINYLDCVPSYRKNFYGTINCVTTRNVIIVQFFLLNPVSYFNLKSRPIVCVYLNMCCWRLITICYLRRYIALRVEIRSIFQFLRYFLYYIFLELINIDVLPIVGLS